jgi:predicted DNA-binding transcriptional regulator AlpA
MPARTRQEPAEEKPASERAAYSVVEFARLHGLSRAHVYNLMRDGAGPRVMRAGRRTLISAEAAADWRRNLEACSAKGDA